MTSAPISWIPAGGTVMLRATQLTGRGKMNALDRSQGGRQRLASALRVNRAADDAASQVVSEGMRAEGTFRIGPDGGETDRIEISLGDLRAGGPEVNLGGTSVASLQGAQNAISRGSSRTISYQSVSL